MSHRGVAIGAITLMLGLLVGLLALSQVASERTKASSPQWWVVLDTDDDGTSYLADSNSINVRENDLRTVTMHYFLSVKEEGVKSSLVTVMANCKTNQFRRIRYVYYDENYRVLRSDADLESPNEVAPVGSPGHRLIRFACGTPEYRNTHFRSIDAAVPYRRIGEFYADKSPIGAPPASSKVVVDRPGDDIRRLNAAYEACALRNARTFAKSGETAPVVARAAVKACAKERAALLASYPATTELGRRVATVTDQRLQEKAELEVVRLRSK